MAPDAYHSDQTRIEAYLRTLILNGVGNPQHYPIQPENLLPDKLQVLDKYHVDHKEIGHPFPSAAWLKFEQVLQGWLRRQFCLPPTDISAGCRREQNLPTSYACSPEASRFMCSEPLALDVTKWWPSAYLHGLVDGMLLGRG